MAVFREHVGVVFCVVFCAILLSCSTILFEPEFVSDEDIPVITVGDAVDTVTIGDQVTFEFNVSDDKDDEEELKKNITFWVENEDGKTVDKESFSDEAGTYTVFLFVTDSDGNTSEIVEITVVVSNEDNTSPTISLLGPVPFIINTGDPYNEPGAQAMDNFDGDITDKIKILGEVDTSDEDEYYLTYTVRDKAGNRAYKERKVIVKDNNGKDKEKPCITLKGSNPMMVHLGDDFEDPGASATDNVDGNITDKIKKTGDRINTAIAGSHKVFYCVEDDAGNVAYAIRVVNVEVFIDSIPPVITLNGDNPLYLALHEKYDEPGADATDNMDGNITDQIEIDDSDIDIYQTGIYEVVYTVSDAAGNEAVEKRVVSVGVIDTVAPVIELRGNNPMLVDYKGPYDEPGAYAVDNVDDTIAFFHFDTDHDINLNELGTYTVNYSVEDNAKNKSTATRKVEVADTIAPVVTIIGPNPVNLVVGFDYIERGATAVDNFDGELTDKLDTLGSVNTSIAGTYEITYKVTDSNDNTGEAVRTINVIKSTLHKTAGWKFQTLR